MTEAALITAIVTAVSAASVDSVTEDDTLRYVAVPGRESPTDERVFRLLPSSVPERRQDRVGGCAQREIVWELSVLYAWTENAVARLLKDGRLIGDALDGLPGGNAEILRVTRVASTIDYGGSSVELSIIFQTTYAAT